jgi:hypothetical protein
MLQLLSLWLAWRTVRLITAVVVIVGVLALLTHGRHVGTHLGDAALTQLRHAVHPVERQLERALEKVLTR